jgi:hypothetical protein
MKNRFALFVACVGIAAGASSLDLRAADTVDGVCCRHEGDCPQMEQYCCEWDEMGALPCSLGDQKDYCLSSVCPGPPGR